MEYVYPVTPQELKDDPLVLRDIFQETLGSLSATASINTMLVNQAWHRFRHRCIGDPEVDFFVQCLQDQADESWLWYSRIVETILDAGAVALFDSESTTNVTNNADIVTTNISHIDNINDLTHETLPATPVSGLSYLDSKDHSDTSSDGDTTNTVADDSTGSTTQTGGSGLKLERLNKLADELKKANSQFMKELEPLFMNHR